MELGGYMDLLFGTTKATQVIDNEGSTETVIENIHNGDIVKPIRKTFEIKIRVHNQSEEHKAYLEFSDDINRDRTMLDPYFKIEHTKLGNESGFYYCIRCYTTLSY